MEQYTIDELLEKARWAKKNSIEQSDLYARALQMAEASQDARRTESIRGDYLDCLVFQGRFELAMPHFAILLSVLDQPGFNQIFETIKILWRYKWFVNGMSNFPNVPKAQIELMMDDMERRYLAFSETTRPTIYYFRNSVYSSLGDTDKADHFQQLYDECEPAGFSMFSLKDCDACQCSSRVSGLFQKGRYEEALAVAAPILSGELKCETVPRTTYPNIILSELLREQGSAEQAEKWFRKSIRLLNAEYQDMAVYGKLICYVALTGNFKKGIELFETQFTASLESGNKYAVFHFYNAAWLLFETMLNSGKKTVKLKLVENDQLFSPDGQYQVPDLIVYFQQTVSAIARRFDERNGNNYYSETLQGIYKALRR